MAKNKIDYVGLTEIELRNLLTDSREKVFQLKFQNATAPIKNPHEIAAAKRTVARCMTHLRQLDLKKAAGVKK